MAISGLGVAYIGAGFVLLYSGYANTTIADTIKSFAGGTKPAANPTGAPSIGVASSSGSSAAASSSPEAPGGTVSAAAAKTNEAAGALLAASYGWTGAQWNALANIVMAESSWNNLAENASGAFGVAQALGHGTAGTAGKYGNQYGGFGLTTAQAQAANNGDFTDQFLWMLGYIKAVYGTPEAAWTFHLANGYY